MFSRSEERSAAFGDNKFQNLTYFTASNPRTCFHVGAGLSPGMMSGCERERHEQRVKKVAPDLGLSLASS